MKFGLHVIAHLMVSQCCGAEAISELVSELLYLGKEICLNPTINCTDASLQKDIVGPLIYLIKILFRDYGSDSLAQLSSIHT